MSSTTLKTGLMYYGNGPSNPPTSKRDLKRMIRQLQPTSCGIEVDLQAALLIVSSDAIEVGFSATWNTDRFLKRFDDLIKGF